MQWWEAQAGSGRNNVNQPVTSGACEGNQLNVAAGSSHACAMQMVDSVVCFVPSCARRPPQPCTKPGVPAPAHCCRALQTQHWHTAQCRTELQPPGAGMSVRLRRLAPMSRGAAGVRTVGCNRQQQCGRGRGRAPTSHQHWLQLAAVWQGRSSAQTFYLTITSTKAGCMHSVQQQSKPRGDAYHA